MSAEDVIDGSNGYFRQNSRCSAEQKTLFRTLPWKKKQLEIEANSRNSIPWNKNRSIYYRNAILNHFSWKRKQLRTKRGKFVCKIPFHSVLFRALELALPRNSERALSSAELRKPFSESFPRNLLGTKFCSQPYQWAVNREYRARKWKTGGVARRQKSEKRLADCPFAPTSVVTRTS